MNRPLAIFYVIALVFHAVVLYCLKPPASTPPKTFNETYVDVTLTKPLEPEPPKPVVVPPPPQPKIETPVPKPEEKPQPPAPPKPEMTIPEPPPPPPESKPVVVPPPQPPTEYVSVTEPKYATHIQPIYPEQAKRWHQQGVVVLALFINESGALDKVEIVKSSGFPLLDNAAIRAMKESRFDPALQGNLSVRSRAEVTITFRLE
jgi:protein TonB